MNKGRVLVIDDEYGIRTGVREILELEGYQVEAVETGREALAILDSQTFDVILIDYRLPDIDGITLLQAIQSRKLDVATCMITAYANIETAIAATREGIDMFLPKPFSPDDLIGVVETLFKHRLIRHEAERLRLAHEASLLALASEKSQTHSLVESLRDAVMVVNRDGEVVLVNPAMALFLKSGDSDLLRKPAEQVLNTGPFTPLAKALSDPAAAGRTVFDIEIDSHQYMVSVTPFHGTNSEILGYILTISDISEVRRMAMEKSRFTRTMVHELRSPLGAVKSVLEVIQDRSLGGEVAPYTALVDRAQKRLDGLVELIGALLTLSQIELEGRTGANVSSTAAAPVVEEIAELYREQSRTAAIELTVTVEPNLQVVINPDDLKTILTNLVGNAIKYNRPGGRASLMANRAGDMVKFEVADTGLGLKAENLSRIFDDFFREKKPETREITGNGLGLAIVKRLVDRYSGKIEVTSAEGQGSTFTILLPSGRPKPAQIDAAARGETKEGGSS